MKHKNTQGKKPLGGDIPIGSSYLQDYKVSKEAIPIKSYPSFKYRQGYISIFPQYIQRYSKSQAIEQTKEACKSQKFKGIVSHRSKMKIGSILETWINALQVKNRINNPKYYQKKSCVTFVTLTLSGKQKHTDQWIKRNMLNVFLVWLTDQKKVAEWMWRAETQENGNVHFHIIMDGFVAWEDIRKEWNSIQDRNGYIDDFARKYKHRDPNSTDIHKIQKIDNVIAYVYKYLTKDADRRKVEGRLWGCSNNIRCYQPWISEIDYKAWQFLEDCKKAKGSVVVEGERWTVIRGEFLELMELKYPKMYKEYIRHLSICIDKSRYNPIPPPPIIKEKEEKNKNLGKQGAINFPL